MSLFDRWRYPDMRSRELWQPSGFGDVQPGREAVRQWRVHAREFDSSTWAVGEWHDGPMPDMGTVAREASTIILSSDEETTP